MNLQEAALLAALAATLGEAEATSSYSVLPPFPNDDIRRALEAPPARPPRMKREDPPPRAPVPPMEPEHADPLHEEALPGFPKAPTPPLPGPNNPPISPYNGKIPPPPPGY